MSTFSVTNQGVITVDTSSIREDFVEAYKTALGANLNTDASTFQGQMIINDTATLTTAMNEVVNIANNFSPYTATGEALDVIATIFGYYRKQGVATTVYLNLTGTSGTVIPAGSLVSDGTHEYASQDEITLVDSAGAGWFQCTEAGAVRCPIATVTSIVTTISGWDTVTNNTAGVTGYATETDNEFRQRITSNWLNVRARSVLGAIIDNVASLDNVISVCGRENPTSNTVSIDGQLLTEHSIYLCVLGGDESEIAKVIANQKTLGAGTNGDTTIGYYDSVVGYNYQYSIQRPTARNLAIQIVYEPNAYTSADVQTQMSSLIMEWLSNNPLKIGQTISGNVLAQALDGFNQVNLLSVKVKVQGDANWTDYITNTIAQVATLDASNISFSEV